MELSHFQLPVRYDTHGSGPERKSAWKVVFVSYGCADRNGATSFLRKNEHFLFTYRCWLAILLHIFRNFSTHLPNKSSARISNEVLSRNASSVANSSVNIHLLASCSDCTSDYQAEVAVDSNVLDGATERTPAVPPGPHGHPVRFTSAARLAAIWPPASSHRQCLMDHTDILCTPLQTDVRFHCIAGSCLSTPSFFFRRPVSCLSTGTPSDGLSRACQPE